MSIFGIDWNGDGAINFEDTAVDCMILNELEEKENKKKHSSFSFDDDDE